MRNVGINSSELTLWSVSFFILTFLVYCHLVSIGVADQVAHVIEYAFMLMVSFSAGGGALWVAASILRIELQFCSALASIALSTVLGFIPEFGLTLSVVSFFLVLWVFTKEKFIDLFILVLAFKLVYITVLAGVVSLVS